MRLRETIAILLTCLVGVVGMILSYAFFIFLRDVLNLDSLTFLGVLITALAAIFGAYSYAKSRLDKVVAQLDELRIWLYFPALRTIPLRLTYARDDALQGIAKYAADKLSEARAGVAGSIPTGHLPLVIDEKIENVDVIKETDDMITLLHGFSVMQFANEKELNKRWHTIFVKTEHAYNAVTAFENQYFEMRHWLRRWITNVWTRIETRVS
jgi:hypothetical protein